MYDVWMLSCMISGCANRDKSEASKRVKKKVYEDEKLISTKRARCVEGSPKCERNGKERKKEKQR